MGVIDEISQDIMVKFLQNHFPVKRLKDGKRFRRGIIIDSGFTGIANVSLFLSNKEDINRAFNILYGILFDVFCFTMYEINMVLLKYLNII